MPAMLWFSMYPDARKGNLTWKIFFALHALLLGLGLFVTIAGT
jgi:hypothetical protein